MPHNRIVRVLHQVGLPDKILTWFNSFFTNRTQFVKLGNSISNDQPVTSGIIQGSVAGPGFSALFVNQLALRLKVPFVFFADDYMMLFSLQLMDTTETQAEIDVF